MTLRLEYVDLADARVVVSTVKSGGTSAMVWGYFSIFWLRPLVLVNGNMSSEVYVNILDKRSMYPKLWQQFGIGFFIISTTVLLFIKQTSLHRGLKTIGWM